jgi:hypothetical protein
MRTGFNIVTFKSIDLVSGRFDFQVALRQFKLEYKPASFVEITEVKHMGTTFDPKREEFTHSFCVSWQEPKEPLENNCE